MFRGSSSATPFYFSKKLKFMIKKILAFYTALAAKPRFCPLDLQSDYLGEKILFG
jgi:hypothetical protein